MNELTINEPQQLQEGIRYRIGAISFDSFDEYLMTAQAIAKDIESIDEPTEDNIREAKAKIAKARKTIDGVNKIRIQIKKQMLTPYDDFEAKVKEITSVIESAENEVRVKVNALEQAQREQKKQLLKEIWNSRSEWYSVIKANPHAFDIWLEPRHLNKTVTIKAAEADMTKWLEEKTSQYDTACSMGIEYETAFLQTYDLNQAIRRVQETQQIRASLKEHQGDDHVTVVAFYVEGELAILKTEVLLKENHIAYQKEEM